MKKGKLISVKKMTMSVLFIINIFSFGCQEKDLAKQEIAVNDAPNLIFQPVKSEKVIAPVGVHFEFQVQDRSVGIRVKSTEPRITKSNQEIRPKLAPTIIPIDRKSLTITKFFSSEDEFIKYPNTVDRTLVVSSEPIKALPMRFKDDAKYNLQYLDAVQGLPSSFVYAMIEDRKGNLWFGTYGGGICRYDGKSIYTFAEKEGLTNNRVRSIIEDKQGNLWFGTNGGGAIKYDGEYFEKYSTANGLSNNVVSCIYEDTRGRIWFGQEDGFVSCLDGDKWFTLSSKHGLGNSMIYTIIEDSKGNIWIGTKGSGLYIFNGREVVSMGVSDGLPNGRIRSIVEDKKGNIWIATNGGGLTMYDGKTLGIYQEKNGLPSTKILSMIQDIEGNLWMGTYGGGVIMFDGQQFKTFKENEGMSNNTVLSILQDSSDNLWFGTNGGGVSKLKLKSFTSSFGDPILSENTIRAISEDRMGNLWFCTDGNGVTKFVDDHFETFTESQGLSNGNIYCMLEDRNGVFWFGTRGGGVVKFDGQYFTTYTTEDGLAGNNIRSMLEDMNGNLWFGSYRNGVSKFDGERFVTLDKNNGLKSNTVRCIMEDRKGNIWLGTDGGGVTKLATDSLYTYTEDNGIASNIVMTIYEDKKGALWFGTWGSGVCRFDGKTFDTYTKESGLTHDLVLSIAEDREQNMWIGTEGGLNLLMPVYEEDEMQYVYASLTKLDGLKRLDLALNSICLDSDNQLWFGLGKGATMLNLNEYKLSTDKPKLQLNDIRIKQTFVDFRKVSDTQYLTSLSFPLVFSGMVDSVTRFYNFPKKIALPYQLNHLSFHFSALDWAASHKLKYQYKLEGFEDEWSPLTVEGVATYRNIPFGSYIFKCRAIGEANIFSNQIAYPINVVTPWSETLWANILFFAAFAGSLFGLYRWRTNRLKHHQDVLKETVALRTAELKSKSNELKVSNEELNIVNANLEKIVIERTAELTSKNKTLSDYAFMNAHNLRVPVANIKGIIQLFDFKISMKEKEELMEKLKSQSNDLDDVLVDIQKRLEQDQVLKSSSKK